MIKKCQLGESAGESESKLQTSEENVWYCVTTSHELSTESLFYFTDNSRKSTSTTNYLYLWGGVPESRTKQLNCNMHRNSNNENCHISSDKPSRDWSVHFLAVRSNDESEMGKGIVSYIPILPLFAMSLACLYPVAPSFIFIFI